MEEIKIAIIGGTGIYEQEEFKIIEKIDLVTPYGRPSAPLSICEINKQKIIFLPRHGERHNLPPHKVNNRANIWALKELGVERILAPHAVGSLKEDLKPGMLIFPDQFIDFTKRRDYSFYDGPKVVHISMAEPFCPELRKILSEISKELNFEYSNRAIYLCIEGPRFSTKAESYLFRKFADIIGMTLIPEVKLARELELCYASISMVTDYDVWRERDEVNANKVIDTMKKNIIKVRKLIVNVIEKIPEGRHCICSKALESAQL
ncbi:MAG TPA: S-methyl-5'-thioadenosine phosphorylase [Candidatus Aenigmarchaeota archaeon]|nr:S-methyl-5'-thioadenosine phosphorylase [Candidatus Aenigmarchaeota archaeon]